MVQEVIKNETIETNSKVYITSDGREFGTKDWAEYHEFTYCKLNCRSLVGDENIIDVRSLDELKTFIKNTYYSDTKRLFNYEELTFPNTYVLEEILIEIENNGEDDVWIREKGELSIYTLDEFKEREIKRIQEFE